MVGNHTSFATFIATFIMSKVVSHKVCLRIISMLHASYDITNSRRYENNVFMELEAIKNMKYIFKKLLQV